MAKFLTPISRKNMTAGEKRFAKMLELYLNDDYLVWYDVPTNSSVQRFPDFLIFNPKYGLLCMEIKDWKWGGKLSVSHDYITRKYGETRKKERHPRMQARDCLLPVINQLNQDKSLLQSVGSYQGKLCFPWGYGAVMSNWRKAQVPDKISEKFYQFFPQDKIFFREDITEVPAGKENFIKKLHGLIPYQFSHHLTKAQANKVRAHIFPEFIIDQNPLFDDEHMKLPDIVKIMDNSQEILARSLGSGHRVIHGVAGSGKTVILEYRAKVLAEKSSDKEILVICFNVLLASKLKHRLALENINVIHFHGWCMQLRDEYDLTVPDGNQKDYFERLAQTVCEGINNGVIPSGKYHAVLIDEGHDFAAEWLVAITKMVNTESNNLLLLYDDAQTIYDNRRGIGFTLSSVGIKARGRTTILQTNYRNSQEILIASNEFIRHFLETTESKDEDEIPLLSMQAGGKQTNNYPIFQLYENKQQEFYGIIRQVQVWQNENVALGDIAILYYSTFFARELNQSLSKGGFPVDFLHNKQSKESYKPSSDNLTLCSIASSKGSEFSHVILVGLGACKDTEEKKAREARLIYVGMTRAKNRLFMTASRKNAFTSLLEESECHF